MGCASSAPRVDVARDDARDVDVSADACATTGADVQDELRVNDGDADGAQSSSGTRVDVDDDDDDDDDGCETYVEVWTPNAREAAPGLTLVSVSDDEAFEPTPRSRLTVTPLSTTRSIGSRGGHENNTLVGCLPSSSEDDALHARLRAMERAVDVLGDRARDADLCEIAYHEMRETYDALRRDARAFCAECALEAEAAMGAAQRAVKDARRALKQQAMQFDGVVDDMERNFRHNVATATLKSKSEAARAKLRASEALQECEKYRHEVLRLQDELQRASDALAISSATVESHIPSSTSKNAIVQLRWRLLTSLALRRSERECVLDAEDCLQAFAEQELQLELAKRDQRSATLALAEMNSMLIESRDEVYDLKAAKQRV